MEATDDRTATRSPSAHEELSIGQMVRANRPHRLVRDLSKVLVATLASAGSGGVAGFEWGRVYPRSPFDRGSLFGFRKVAI